MHTLTVPLRERSYPIHVGEGLLAEAGSLLATQSVRRAVIVTNATVARYHLEALHTSLAGAGIATETVLIPDGEAHKSLHTLEDVLTRLITLGAERSTWLVALGGGVVGDVTGFAAAVYQRGVPYAQVPTTLLAQVDSSVGGKTAVNHPLGKNMIGAFHQPRAVLVDTATLRTLPEPEFAAGIAEVIKYGAIRDAGFFAWLEAHLSDLRARRAEALAHAILESCRIKAAIVAEDERETGLRALLNFGHTFGHAIETASGYGSWLHGEAVGAGMVLAARLSMRVCGLEAGHAARLEALVAKAGLPVGPPPMPIDRWLELMGRDKKVEQGRMRFVLLDRIGSAGIYDDVARGDLVAVLD